MLISTAAAQLNSRFTPMPFGLHIGFCLFATVVFLTIFLRRKTISSLVWLLICDATAILQFYPDKTTATAVGICEIFLFVVLFWTSTNEKIEKKRRQLIEVVTEEEDPDDEPLPEDLKDIEQLIRSETSNIADNSGGVIENAFEDDRR